MKHNQLKRFAWLHLLLWVGLLQPDGFAERTLVMSQQGLKPIEQFVVGNNVVVVAAGGQLQPYSITRTMSYVADSFIKIQVNDVCICAAPHQKFYSCDRTDWVNANELKVSEQLLCGSGNVVCVSAVETVHKQQKMHTFTVDTSHVFCVTPYEIMAHNIDPATTIATVATLSVACPPAAVAVAVGQAAAFVGVGCVMYCMHRRAHKHDLRHNGCFSPESSNGTSAQVATGCYHPMPDVPLVCDIGAGKEVETAKITPYENPEVVTSVGCEFPVADAEMPILHHATTKQTDVDAEGRYNGPWYNRTEDWIKDHLFGQKIKKLLQRTDYIKQGKRAFRVIEKIEGCYGFNKGDYIIIDGLHKDHLEVYGSNKKWKQVANFDGTRNEKKTEQGKEEPRQPL
jgi:hypothetical protein